MKTLRLLPLLLVLGLAVLSGCAERSAEVEQDLNTTGPSDMPNPNTPGGGSPKHF